MTHRRAKPHRDVLTITRFVLASAGRPLLLGALLSTLTVLIGVGLLGISGWFITATALAGLSPLLALRFDVFMPSAAIRLLALGRTVSRYGERVVTHDATLAVLAALRERVFLGWAQPMAARRLAARPSRWLFRLTGDIDALETIYLRLAAPAIAAVGAAVLAGLLIGMSHTGLGVAVGSALIVCGGGIAWGVMARARPVSMRRARALESLRAHAINLVAGQTELIMANRMDAQRNRLHEADRRLARADLALNTLDVRAGWASNVAGAAIVASVLLAAAALAQAGAITTPVAAMMVLVALAAMEPFGALRRGALEAGRTWLAARRIAPRLRQAAENTEPAMPPDGLAVRLRSAAVTHPGESIAVLHDITLDIADGERVAIVGESGAGKSTLLALIAGELHADPADERTKPTVATRTATLFTQRTELFQDSVRDNLRLAEPQADDTRLWQALTDAGLAQDIAALPLQLDTLLGEGGMGLSGGQSRRLALARLLLTDTRLWLLDEPSEGLDSATAHDVLTRLAYRTKHDATANATHGPQTNTQPRTLIIATHLQREAALADRLLVIHAGRITQDLHRHTPEFNTALAALRLD